MVDNRVFATEHNMDGGGGALDHRHRRERLLTSVRNTEFTLTEHRRIGKHYAEVPASVLPEYVRQYRVTAR